MYFGMFFFFFKQKTAYEMRISDWSSDVCSSDLGRYPGLAAGLGEGTHAADVGLALGHRDDPARVEQVEGMARLHALVIGGQRHRPPLVVGELQDRLALRLGVLEVPDQDIGRGDLEIEGGELRSEEHTSELQ